MLFEQLRYFNGESKLDNMNNLLIENENNVLGGKEASRLSIQTLPGTRFLINGSECVVGSTGIWELDLSSYAQNLKINSLRFKKNSIQIIKANENAYLIIDAVMSDASTA